MRLIPIALLALIAGCAQNNGPVAIIGTPAQPTPSGPALYIVPFGEQLDTLYVKIWSDSSWTAFGGYDTIGSTPYFVLASSSGTDYLYGPAGYAGFIPYGEPLILFDTPIGPWQDSLQIGGTIQQNTTFSFQGNGYAMSLVNTLIDTQSVTTDFGVFSPCLHFAYTELLTVGGSTSPSYSEYWEGVGPGEVEEANSLGQSIVMVRGYVNGRIWGPGLARTRTAQATQRLRDLSSTVMFGIVHSPLAQSGTRIPRRK
ncbi:MAG TPA: hypothetical protein VL221_07270 [Bacteroidota bacterium]|nr:hypothetical protein [Bacteroidota bacterium]